MQDITYIPIETTYIISKNKILPVELGKEDENVWSVKVPSLPSSITWAGTKREVLQKVRDVLDGMKENHEICYLLGRKDFQKRDICLETINHFLLSSI